MALNDYETIVSNLKSSTLVLAGPGAGKTHLLADRIKRLLDNGTDKGIITVLTFGKDANQHMIYKLTEPSSLNIPFKELPHISTMHSLGLKIICEKPRDVNLLKTDLKVQENENIKRLMYRDAALMMELMGSGTKIDILRADKEVLIGTLSAGRGQGIEIVEGKKVKYL